MLHDAREQLVEQPLERKVRERGVGDALQVTELVVPLRVWPSPAILSDERTDWDNRDVLAGDAAGPET